MVVAVRSALLRSGKDVARTLLRLARGMVEESITTTGEEPGATVGTLMTWPEIVVAAAPGRRVCVPPMTRAGLAALLPELDGVVTLIPAD